MPNTHKKNIHAKSIFSLLLSKMVIVALLILIQIAILVLLVLFLSDYFTIVYGVLSLLSVGIAVWLVSKNENPSYKLAWIIPIMLFPLFGGVFYLMFGNQSMPKKLVDRIREAEKNEHRVAPPDEPCAGELITNDPQLGLVSNYITRTTGSPVWKNTKAAEGVEVRFMYDDLGSIMTLPVNYDVQLRNAGIQCAVFNPFKPHLNATMNYRDHRKITVIDGNVGFCGGINIADEYINAYEKHGHWKDTGVLLRGDAVWNLTAMFLSLWNFTSPTDKQFEQYRPTIHCESDGYVQPFGDSPLDHINVSEETYMQIINRATRYVYITTPYLILDNEMITALQVAARSGVDVRIVTPHVPDKWLVHQTTQSFYQVLLDAGVRIYEYTPGFVHAKMYVSDDTVAIVGTANMDYRSFYLHFECGVCFFRSSVVQDVRADIEHLLTQCFEIPKDYIRHVRLWKRIVRAFLRLFSPMM